MRIGYQKGVRSRHDEWQHRHGVGALQAGQGCIFFLTGRSRAPREVGYDHAT